MTARRNRQPDIVALIDARLSRRAVLKGVAASGGFALFGRTSARNGGGADGSTPLTFAEVGRSTDDKHHVAPSYDARVLIRHGDPIRRGAPQYRPRHQTASDQWAQFGTDNDFIAYMPLPRGSGNPTRALLGVNHEAHRSHLCFPGSPSKLTREQCEIQMAAHGFSVIEIAKQGNTWRLIDESRYNRRITARTPMRASGPAAGSSRLQTGSDLVGVTIEGTLSNCAGGTTPWHTVLTAEENFHLYFSGDARKGTEASARARYNIMGRGYYPDWARYFDRFDMEKEPNEPNRFGWIVEIDPYDPSSTPVKRTALGRCAHECATSALSHDGRVAIYSGDDAAMEYVYKFVTRDRAGTSPDLLDQGTLYVARFQANGKMSWLPLVFGQGPLTPENNFRSQADVLIEARRAADLLGATPMDRPEDVEAHPATGRIYVVLTSNWERKQANAANPRAPNRHGHIIEIVPPLVDGRPDHGATECEWGFFLLGGDPADPIHGARYANPIGANGWIACPDNIAFDPQGRIWIATDGQGVTAGFNDSLYAAQTSGPNRGATRCFFTGPRGAEICGPAFAPDGRTLFIAVQHPGSEKGSTFDQPSTRWPDFERDMPPRSAVVAITKADGGEIGR